MSPQHDLDLANNSGAAFRADLNLALQALQTNSSGPDEIADVDSKAYQFWADTTAGIMKMRNGADNGWVSLFQLDGTSLMEDGTVSDPGLAFADDLNTGFYRPGADQLAIATNGIERVEFGTTEVVFNDGGEDIDFRIEGDTEANLLFVDAGNDRVGIGTATPSVKCHVQDDSLTSTTSGTNVVARFQTNGTGYDASILLGDAVATASRIGQTSGNITFHPGSATERVRIDSSGRLLVGTSGVTDSNAKFVVEGRGVVGAQPAQVHFRRNEAATAITDNEALGFLVFTDNADNQFAVIGCVADADAGSGDYPGRLTFSTTADGASGATERMRIHSTGYMNAGGFLETSDRHRLNGINALQGTLITTISAYQTSGGTNSDTAEFFSVIYSGISPSTADTAMKVYRNSGTTRSISANGTINASGADYAEYMLKSGDFTIAKGDVCGINAEGKLTNVFADAISFVVKSTDPSYVGGDSWHKDIGEEPGGYDDDRTEEEIAAAKIVYKQELEAARQMVDRIAFSGQVPVNVTGTTPGQYIVPAETADGGIEGVAKNEADLTLTEYMRAIGKVIAIEDDGRARIIVKVA